MIWFPELLKFDTVEQGKKYLAQAEQAYDLLNSPKLKEQVREDIKEIILKVQALTISDAGKPPEFIKAIDWNNIVGTKIRNAKEKDFTAIVTGLCSITMDVEITVTTIGRHTKYNRKIPVDVFKKNIESGEWEIIHFNLSEKETNHCTAPIHNPIP